MYFLREGMTKSKIVADKQGPVCTIAYYEVLSVISAKTVQSQNKCILSTITKSTSFCKLRNLLCFLISHV